MHKGLAFVAVVLSVAGTFSACDGGDGKTQKDSGMSASESVMEPDAGTSGAVKPPADVPCNGANEFRCNDGTCIVSTRVCDRVADCADQSDERICRACTANEFSCGDGSCVARGFRCDGVSDCPNRADEAGCSVACNQVDQFSCGDGTCVSRDFRCDGVSDCRSGADEALCSTSCESFNQFSCGDGTCVSREFRCDGVVDCSNRTDEANCTTFCDGFSCSNGTCISRDYRCDGYSDCSDGSDERSCSSASCGTIPTPAGYSGTTGFTQAALDQCLEFCSSDESCINEANCPGINRFYDCVNDELSACTAGPTGKCRAQYESYACCVLGSSCSADDDACFSAVCATQGTAFSQCAETDQTCIAATLDRCTD